jgi:hypothetical protein
MKNPVIFTVLLLAILIGAAIMIYLCSPTFLHTDHLGCGTGGGKSLGCSTSFGAFITGVTVVVGLAVGAAWSKFGR